MAMEGSNGRARSDGRGLASMMPGGVLAPVATTFGADGELDLAPFQVNLEWYARSRLDGVVLLGSNGEFALLDTSEKEAVIEAGIETIVAVRHPKPTEKDRTIMVVSPCGSCRELIWDYDRHARVIVPGNGGVTVTTIGELLPNKYRRGAET